MVDFTKKGTNLDINMMKGLHHMLGEKDMKMFTYGGSLTTPTCSEVVDFYIVDHVYPISTNQLNDFRALFNNNAKFANSVGNYRITKPLNSRTIQYGDFQCLKKEEKGAYNVSIALLSVLAVLMIALLQ